MTVQVAETISVIATGIMAAVGLLVWHSEFIKPLTPWAAGLVVISLGNLWVTKGKRNRQKG